MSNKRYIVGRLLFRGLSSVTKIPCSHPFSRFHFRDESTSQCLSRSTPCLVLIHGTLPHYEVILSLPGVYLLSVTISVLSQTVSKNGLFKSDTFPIVTRWSLTRVGTTSSQLPVTISRLCLTRTVTRQFCVRGFTEHDDRRKSV